MIKQGEVIVTASSETELGQGPAPANVQTNQREGTRSASASAFRSACGGSGNCMKTNKF